VTIDFNLYLNLMPRINAKTLECFSIGFATIFATFAL